MLSLVSNLDFHFTFQNIDKLLTVVGGELLGIGWQQSDNERLHYSVSLLRGQRFVSIAVLLALLFSVASHGLAPAFPYHGHRFVYSGRYEIAHLHIQCFT